MSVQEKIEELLPKNDDCMHDISKDKLDFGKFGLCPKLHSSALTLAISSA